MRRKLLILAAVALLAAPAIAELWTNNDVNVTDTSQTITFPRAMSTVLVINDGANEVYYRLFDCTDTAAAATVADTVPLSYSGESKGYPPPHSPTRAGPTGWCAISLICDTGETATVRLEGQ